MHPGWENGHKWRAPNEVGRKLRAWNIRDRWKRHADRLGPLPDKWARVPPAKNMTDVAMTAWEAAFVGTESPFTSTILLSRLRP